MDPPRAPVARLRLAAVAVALLCVVALLPALASFGPTWDLVLGGYGYGHDWLDAAVHGRTDELPPLPDAPAARYERSAEPRAPHPDFDGARFPPHLVYPLGGMLSALACDLLWTRTGWLPAQHAHHVPALLFLAALLATLVLSAGRRLGAWAAAGAVVAALSQPRLLTHGLHNLKDFPEAVLMFWALLACVAALHRPRAHTWLLAGALWGLALAQKANALFVPVEALTYLVLYDLWCARRRRVDGAQAPPALRVPWLGALLAAACAAVVLFAVSPALWHDTWARLAERVTWVREAGRQNVPTHPFVGVHTLLVVTPLPLLALAAVGLVFGRMSAATRLLLCVGLGVPLARTMLPLRFHGGLRQVLELTPFLCLACGAGVQRLVEWTRARRPTRAATAAAVASLALALLPAWRSGARAFPHGVAWFNAAAGGLAGARASHLPDAGDTWAGSLWQGLDWLSDHAEPDARVWVPVAPHVAEAARPVRLRADLRLVDVAARALDDPADPTPLYVAWVVLPSAEAAPFAAWLDASHAVHELRVQAAPILRLLRVDDAAERARVLALARGWRRLQPALRAWAAQVHGDAADSAWLDTLLDDGALPRLRAALERADDPRWRRLALEVDALQALADELTPLPSP